jgi:hypothetical protein
MLVYVESSQSYLRYLKSYRPVALNLGEVSDAPQQEICYTRSSAAAARNLECCFMFDRNA